MVATYSKLVSPFNNIRLTRGLAVAGWLQQLSNTTASVEQIDLERIIVLRWLLL